MGSGLFPKSVFFLVQGATFSGPTYTSKLDSAKQAVLGSFGLKQNLKTCAESLMRFQHLCARMAEQQLKGFMNEFLDTMGIETEK